MSLMHYTLATYLIREIDSGEIKERFESGEVSSFQLASEFRCDSTTALWALRLLAECGRAHFVGSRSYGAETYRIFGAKATVVKIPERRLVRTWLN